MLRQLLLASHRAPASFAAANFEFHSAALKPLDSSSASRRVAATLSNRPIPGASRIQRRQCPAEYAASPLRNCTSSSGTGFPDRLFRATAKPSRFYREGARHNMQIRSQERGVRFYSTCSSERPTTPLSGRRRLRFIDKTFLTPNTKDSNNNNSNVSSSSSCDVIVSCGTHGGGDLGRRSLQLEGTGLSYLPRSRRDAIQRKPLLPVEPRNLRQPGLRRKKHRRGRGDKGSAKGIRLKRDQQGRFKGPRSRTFEGGKTPLYRHLPKWPAAWLGRRRKRWEPLNLAKVRSFLEQGRLDARYPITQRHLHDSRCVKVRNGVHLFNVNDFPFPYKITIDVASADQSSIDAIRRVGGEVRVVYRHPINLRAHVKPYKFDVLPKTARPGLEAVHFLEKMRARGCVVSYVKPEWLEAEEKRLQAELQELKAEAAIAAGLGADPKRPPKADVEAIAAYRAKALRISELEKQEKSNDSKQNPHS